MSIVSGSSICKRFVLEIMYLIMSVSARMCDFEAQIKKAQRFRYDRWASLCVLICEPVGVKWNSNCRRSGLPNVADRPRWSGWCVPAGPAYDYSIIPVIQLTFRPDPVSCLRGAAWRNGFTGVVASLLAHRSRASDGADGKSGFHGRHVVAQRVGIRAGNHFRYHFEGGHDGSHT